MNCRETQKALDEQPVNAHWLPGIREHLEGCPDCRQLARVLSSAAFPHTPSPPLLDKIAGSILADFQVVRPLASRATYFAIFSTIVVLAAALSIRALYPYGWEEMGALETTLILVALGLSAAALIRSLVKQMTPAGRYKIAPEWLPPIAVTILAVGTGFVFRLEREEYFWAGVGVCLKIGLAFAIPTAVALWLVLRRGVLLYRGITGACTGVLAGLVGASALEVHCPNLNAWHILLSHVGVAVVGGLAGSAIGLLARPLHSKRTPLKSS